ncbi:hypothetical protein [Acuticoccus sp. I52.16.1]|uniref:hypothetical protein n=1 Tax=Acuticoccus sp. I52.16.1 TaxID=2928472 RepID=UPI001FD033F0|nr:hypothetical protein [Acuticoccus sp. I52.16.1]UOM34195.1 hypothetical protein MRB58_20585 [Acuticoccus sp. I52.16.1]
MFESALASAPPQMVLLAAPPWYDCGAALARLTRLLEGAVASVEPIAPTQLDARLWGASAAHALLLHPSAEDFATAAVRDGAAIHEAIAAWTRHSATLVLQCRRLGTRCTLLDPHATIDDDALAATLGAHLGLPLAGDADAPHRSRQESAAASVVRFLCRLAALEEPAVESLAAALRPSALPLWSAPIRTSLDEALAALAAPRTPTDAGPTAADRAELAATRARLAEVEGQNAQLHEQIALLQEAVGVTNFDGTTPQHQTIYADESLTHPAFYPPERRPSDGLSLRWIGNEDDAVLPTEIGRTRALRVDVQIAVIINMAALDGFSVTCDGLTAVEVVRTKMDDGGWLHSSTFAAPANPDPLALVRLGLHVTSKLDLTDKGDPRFLSVGIHRVDLWQLDEAPIADGTLDLGVDAFPAPAFAAAESLPTGERVRRLGGDAVVDLSVEIAGPLRVEVFLPRVAERRQVEGLRIALGEAIPERTEITPLGDHGAVKTALFESAAGPRGPLTLMPDTAVTSETPGLAVARILVRPA